MPEIHIYISAKVVKAYRDDRVNMGKGYKVIYPDGYESWCPLETFNRTYRMVDDEIENLQGVK